ncbi:MAG TPA: hypothetical protein VFY60_06515 [Pyrinomonadaceae bacterium]|nr:hypothetical protein [Pyrinomonadaceae bacterium]
MGAFSKWLLHEDQKEFFDYLFAIVLNAVFLALIALLLWPMGRAKMALSLAKGYWIFWTAVILISSILVVVQRILRMNLDSHFDAYVISALIVSGVVQVGWSAFLAPLVHNFVVDAPVWLVVILYVVGVLSCYVACVIVSAFFRGALYRFANLILAIVSFIVFSVWPAAGNAMYGWFFDLFDPENWSIW